jgi:hypothetical protein
MQSLSGSFRSLVVVMGFVVPTAACYHYSPVQEVRAEAGHEVRLHLTDRASVDLADQIGPRVEVVEGELLAVSDTAYTLRMSAAFARGNVETPWAGERVTFARGDVARVERKSFDRGRSFVIGGGAVAGALLAGIAFNSLGGSGNSRRGAPGQTPR